MTNSPQLIRTKTHALALSSRGQLVSLVHAATGTELLDPQVPARALWRLTLCDTAGQSRTVTSLDARHVRSERVGDGLHLTWHAIKGAAGLHVWVRVEPAGDQTRWWLSVAGLTPESALWCAEFPCVDGLIRPGVAEDERLLVPRAGGYVVHAPSDTLLNRPGFNPYSLPYPGGGTMQFIAYYRHAGPGLYMAALDPQANYKRLTIEKNSPKHGPGLTIAHYPAGMPQPRGTYEVPYPVAITTFTGDWWAAAEIYRQWGEKQPWCHKGRLHEREDIPPWLRDLGLWVWNRGTSHQVLPGARQMQDRVGAPVAIDWYWWHKTPYDTYFPEYLPPREGAEPFAEAVRALHDDDLRAIVYLNGRLWGTGAPSWQSKKARASAVKQADGDIYREVYNVFNGAEMSPMCPATPFWQETLADIVGEVIQHYALDGVYIDQIASAPPQLCFDPSHGHPAGGGDHWYQGYRALLQRIYDATRDRPDAIFTTEGSCEAYIDLVSNFLVLDNSFERMGFYNRIGLSWEPVPLYSAVYHEYAIYFGSYASLAPPPYDDLWPRPGGEIRSSRFRETDFAAAFYAELGRAFVAGMQPMVSNVYPEQLDDPSLKEYWVFLRNLVQTRLAAMDFLLYGRWLPPPALDVAQVDVDFLVRGIYTPPGQAHIVTRRMPAVLCSAWRAADGRIGLALCNVSSRPQELVCRMDLDAYGLASGPVELIRIDGSGRWPLETIRGGSFHREGVVPPHDVHVLELR